MGVFDDAPPLFVPDLQPAAAAVVDADGQVACVVCGARVAVGTADVVGAGYRCAPCSARAEVTALAVGQDDVSSHLGQADRVRMRRSGARMVVVGVLAIAVALPILVLIPGAFAAAATPASLGMGMMAVGGARMRAAGPRRLGAGMPVARLHVGKREDQP